MKKLFAYMGSALMLFTLGAGSVSAIIPPIVFDCHSVHTCGVYVDDSAAPAGDGTKAMPFQKITDAVNYLKANADYISIWVAGGNYSAETLPWVLDGSTYTKAFNISGGWSASFATQNLSTTPSNIQAGSSSGVFDLTSVASKVEGFEISGVDGTQGVISIANQGATTFVSTVQNNVIHDNTTPGSNVLAISLSGSNTATVKGNKLYSNTATGGTISSYNGRVTASNNLYYANKSGSNGVSLACVNGALVYNNYILGNTTDYLVGGIGTCQFINNTVARNQVNFGADHGVIVSKNNGNVFNNNVIAYNVGDDTFVHILGDTSTFDYNALFSNANDPALSGNNLTCDPKFGGSDTDPNNYKLGSGSSCIDKGMTESAVTDDYFATIRPLDGDGNGTSEYDPGAFEAPAASVSAPSINGLGVMPASFSPNGDGTNDTTTISFNLSADANVTVSIMNSSNVEMKRLVDNQSKTAGSVLVTWDGKDSSNNVLADATYTVKVTAINGGGTDTKSANVIVSVNPPPPPPPVTECAGYTDVAANNPNCDAIVYVKSIGAMTGNPDGTFAPDSFLQRDQVAKIVLQTFNKYVSGTDYCGGVNPFPDVTSIDWSFQYICRGKNLGIITGYLAGVDAGFYRPGRSVNRVEFLALLLRNLSDPMPSNSSSSYVDVATGQWFTGYAKYSFDNSLFTGSYLYPTQATSRVEVAVVIYKLHNLGKI